MIARTLTSQELDKAEAADAFGWGGCVLRGHPEILFKFFEVLSFFGLYTRQRHMSSSH